MHFSTLLAAASITYTGTTLAAPLSAAQMGSKHTLYLSTCTTRSLLPGCPLIIICPSGSSSSAAQTYTAAAYYSNTFINGNDNPTEIVTVSERGEPWEGARRAARMRNGAFTSNIDAGAAELGKSEIAGKATLGNEDFVCFKDGQSTFTVGDGLLGRERAECTADYWCASIE